MIQKYYLDVFPRMLYIAIDETSGAIKDYLKGNKGDNIPDMGECGNAYTLCVSDGEFGGVLLRFKDRKAATPSVIAHECFHAVCEICEYLDIPISGETGAYMIGWCVNKVNEFLGNNE